MPEDNLQKDISRNREIIAKGSKSFAFASLILDQKTRAYTHQLYAWCRYCDDEIDGQTLGFDQQTPKTSEQRQRFKYIEEQTQLALTGESLTNPVMRGLQRVCLECEIPAKYPLDLLKGFAMDINDHVYTCYEDTLRYCYYVAGSVGVMMAIIMGIKDQSTLTRAMDLGIAFQLTNISRDVYEDLEQGRVYIPEPWLQDVGISSQADMFDRSQEVFNTVERLLDDAENYYTSATYGIAKLPFRSAMAIAVARLVYREIGRVVKVRGKQAWDSRVSVSKIRKASFVLPAIKQVLGNYLGATSMPSERLNMFVFPSE